jgi:very-short-patch-repair endonuclease
MDWKEKLNAYREFYEDLSPKILKDSRWSYKNVIREFILDHGGLSPIEEIVWDNLYIQGLVFYPQYPVLNYMTDFCNPRTKIIIECDGEKFHDVKKDKIRDTVLKNQGYKIFRLTGKKINADHYAVLEKIEELDDSFEDDPEVQQLYSQFYCETAYGFTQSLKDILFNPQYFTHKIHHFDHKSRSLMVNRIVDFDVLPKPETQKS